MLQLSIEQRTKNSGKLSPKVNNNLLDHEFPSGSQFDLILACFRRGTETIVPNVVQHLIDLFPFTYTIYCSVEKEREVGLKLDQHAFVRMGAFQCG